MADLNKLKIPGDQYQECYDLEDYSIEKGIVNVYFKNQKSHLIENIRKSKIILGCVAWLTDFEIIHELAQKETVIIVQKEDFLRPDLNTKNDNMWKNNLHNSYSKLKFNYTRYNFENLLSDMSVASDPDVSPVRCVGNYNSSKKSAFPRMHNKFLVFCNVKEKKIDLNGHIIENEIIEPYSVWTGSYNITNNAAFSFENTLLINDYDIAEAYYNEFGQIAALSEPLDWSSKWVAPEWRIGS